MDSARLHHSSSSSCLLSSTSSPITPLAHDSTPPAPPYRLDSQPHAVIPSSFSPLLPSLHSSLFLSLSFSGALWLSPWRGLALLAGLGLASQLLSSSSSTSSAPPSYHSSPTSISAPFTSLPGPSLPFPAFLPYRPLSSFAPPAPPSLPPLACLPALPSLSAERRPQHPTLDHPQLCRSLLHSSALQRSSSFLPSLLLLLLLRCPNSLRPLLLGCTS
ncbi:hypothetical protein Mapa_014106 [Marchantia paleacea]|nr:hypothetical protein Mapa_014106 [Marchantia paleacea]